MPKFDKDLCAQRWSLEAYTGSCQLTQNDACDGYEEVEVSMRKDERVLSSHQKFRKGATVASKLAEVAAECSMPTFRKKLEVLETILKHWKNGCEVNVTVVRPSQQLHSPCDVEKVASTSCPAGDLQPLTEAPQTGVAVLPAPHPGSERLFCGRGLPDNSDSACPGSASSRNTQGSPSASSTGKDCNTFKEQSQDSSAENSFNQDCTASASDPLERIKVPVAMKKCGRPKGHMLTVVGLPKKRKRTTSQRPYAELTVKEKKLVLLTWLVGAEKAAEAIRGKLLDEEVVEQRPEKIPDGIRDEIVDVKLVRRFFTNEAWQAVCMVVDVKKVQEWQCNLCKSKLDDSDSVLCDWCLSWNHLQCVGLKQQPKAKLWKCSECACDLAC